MRTTIETTPEEFILHFKKQGVTLKVPHQEEEKKADSRDKNDISAAPDWGISRRPGSSGPPDARTVGGETQVYG